MLRFSILTSLVLTLYLNSFAQEGLIKGHVYDIFTQLPLVNASIYIPSQLTGTYSDSLGNFYIEEIDPGIYNIEVNYTGYESEILYSVRISRSKTTYLEVALTADVELLEETNIESKGSTIDQWKPLSYIGLRSQEIESQPGANRDISKVIQALPGVASTLTFRNDLIVRGGAPGENTFYLDGIPIPAINHFAAEGAW